MACGDFLIITSDKVLQYGYVLVRIVPVSVRIRKIGKALRPHPYMCTPYNFVQYHRLKFRYAI